LDRLDGMIAAMRRERRIVLDGIGPLGNLGLRVAPMNSPDDDCATQVLLSMPSSESADRFVEVFPSVIAGKTGRHNYTEWDQVLMRAGAAHAAMNPFEMAANAECRRICSKDMCSRSLAILNRTVMVGTHPQHRQQDIEDIIHNIGEAARVVFAGLPKEDADIRRSKPVDAQKFDLKVAT
jgi:hypothetical protein